MIDHYFSQKQQSPLRTKTLKICLKDDSFEILGADGIFAKDGLDFGTKLLIESAEVASGMRVLDLGCGYGVVGIAIQRRHPDAVVVMSDVNERAVKIAQNNALHLCPGKIEVRQSDLFERLPERFDAILVNPPHAAGREVCYRMILDSKGHLEKGGSLQLVARHAKGGAMLEKKMEEIFGNVRAVAKQGGFRVYASVKS